MKTIPLAKLKNELAYSYELTKGLSDTELTEGRRNNGSKSNASSSLVDDAWYAFPRGI